MMIGERAKHYAARVALMIQEAIEEEREACARLIESRVMCSHSQEYAANIRARGKPEKRYCIEACNTGFRVIDRTIGKHVAWFQDNGNAFIFCDAMNTQAAQ